MLDDIVLDGLPYGHVISNPSMPELNGVSVPYDVGVLVEIDQFQEQGSNFTISSKWREKISYQLTY